ncbi:hypothetical protein BD779DRAFT_1403105, partial [Infundibulicybe gibba]
LILYGNTNIVESDLPHRKTLTRLITAAYENQQDELKSGALGRISFTADIWSDPQLTSFMAITSHCMSRNEDHHLCLVSRLL